MTHKNLFFFLLFIAMLAWGGSWVNVKILGHYISAYEMIFLRFGITAITMVPIIIWLKHSFKIDLKSFGLVVLVALALIFYNKYYYLGTKFGTASLGGAMVTTMIPILTFVLLALMGVKKVSSKDLFALALGAVGVLTMLHIWTFDLAHILLIQNLYFIIAAFLWAILTIISSKSTKISPIVFTFYMYIMTVVLDCVLLVDVSAMPFETFDGIFWINMLLISLAASTFANTIFFLGIEKLGAAEVSSFVFLVPFSAIGLSAIFLDEKVDLFIIIGTILTLFAVKMLNNITILKRRRKSVE
ncbi:DMT family transporter [Sulfurospirillum multivorans]|uniref:Membrane protein n=2 Tax=Sulfurospirillum multivorans TaxID=66821 RepID=A0AA86AKQ5_SULMK|nr:DMT family transporter [Sulfurospirillum multivorans]AHJ11362.1 membrane protein [Sulfurospirillum multivorans DSM 12446]QEH04866.1 membrane protein [Sulfurospirillum multivorans]